MREFIIILQALLVSILLRRVSLCIISVSLSVSLDTTKSCHCKERLCIQLPYDCVHALWTCGVAARQPQKAMDDQFMRCRNSCVHKTANTVKQCVACVGMSHSKYVLGLCRHHGAIYNNKFLVCVCSIIN